MDQYKVIIFFNAARDPLTMLVDEGDRYRLRLAIADQTSVADIKRHGFIKGNDLGIRVSVNGKNVDYMTEEKYVVQGA